MNKQELLVNVLSIIPLVLSLTVHEFAHAWSAWRLGDDTAARMGRLTLNPAAHIDWIGTLLLPLLGVPFGWAKPVPINPVNFTRRIRMGTGMMLTAAAGPLSNIVLAVLGAVAYGLMLRWAPNLVISNPAVVQLIGIVIVMNVSLALFNLIPVPPLDGSRVLDWLMPLRFRPTWERIAMGSPFLLLGVMAFGGKLIAGPSRAVMNLLTELIRAIVG